MLRVLAGFAPQTLFYFPGTTSQPIHLILSPGTRIVTRNDANRLGGGQLIAAGAVAVVIDSPAAAQHAYKVRFNDGAEAMLRRTEFSILKEFKGVPGAEENGFPRPSDGRGASIKRFG